MQIGAFTEQFDLPLLLVQLFFLFFLGLVYHLRQEDKREGYPLVSHRTDRTGGRVRVVGFPPLPAPKAFIQPHGRPIVYAPAQEEPEEIAATNLRNPNGMPIEPVGNPLLSRTGAASWMPKLDEPDLSWDGHPVFAPLRLADEFRVMSGDPDPRGFAVLGMDKVHAGRVVDIWVDTGEHSARFLEVELDGDDTASPVAVAATAAVGSARALVARVTGTLTQTGHAIVGAVLPGGGDSESDRERAARRAAGEPSPAEDRRARIDIDVRQAVPPPPGRVLLPIEFASVNGRKHMVRTAAITAAQFADIPGRRADTILTAREEQRIRGYFGGGMLWNTPNRFGPLL